MSVLAVLTGLRAALAGPVNPRQATEVTTSTAAAVSTITGYAHPLTLTALTTLGAAQTPLSYGDTPSPSYVPTRTLPPAAEATEAKVVAAQDDDAPPTSVSVCTSIAGVYATATIPNFCNPSALANAPDFATDTASMPAATVSIGGVSNKLDCCVQCADIFNCVAWKFVPVYTQKPNAHLPGGFDPWGRGDCVAMYHTGAPQTASPAGGNILAVTSEETANLCPNGKIGEILAGSENAGGAQNSSAEAVSSWSNLYYNGWNEGPCAEPVAPFETGTDSGRGDQESQCS